MNQELKFLPNTNFVYEIGDFDAFNTYNLYIKQFSPELSFRIEIKEDDEEQSTSIYQEVILPIQMCKENDYWVFPSQGNFPKEPDFCPFFILSKKMFHDLSENKTTTMRGGFVTKNFIHLLKFREYGNKIIRINHEEVMVETIVIDLYNQNYIEQPNKKQLDYNDGEIIILNNDLFPILIEANCDGGMCEAKLLEIKSIEI